MDRVDRRSVRGQAECREGSFGSACRPCRTACACGITGLLFSVIHSVGQCNSLEAQLRKVRKRVDVAPNASIARWCAFPRSDDFEQLDLPARHCIRSRPSGHKRARPSPSRKGISNVRRAECARAGKDKLRAIRRVRSRFGPAVCAAARSLPRTSALTYSNDIRTMPNCTTLWSLCRESTIWRA